MDKGKINEGDGYGYGDGYCDDNGYGDDNSDNTI
jgi:hypothetical protein